MTDEVAFHSPCLLHTHEVVQLLPVQHVVQIGSFGKRIVCETQPTHDAEAVAATRSGASRMRFMVKSLVRALAAVGRTRTGRG
jgi:hypothetical protein